MGFSLIPPIAQAQRDKYLPKLLTGEHIGSLAMSEPNAGSDVVSMRSKAEKKDGVWVLNGSKCWYAPFSRRTFCRFGRLFGIVEISLMYRHRITNAPLSSTFIIYARTSTEGPPSKGITAFLVERGFKGFEVGEHLDKFGVSGTSHVATIWCSRLSWLIRLDER